MEHVDNFLSELQQGYLPGTPMSKEWFLAYGNYIATSAPEIHKRAEKAADLQCAGPWTESFVGDPQEENNHEQRR